MSIRQPCSIRASSWHEKLFQPPCSHSHTCRRTFSQVLSADWPAGVPDVPEPVPVPPVGAGVDPGVPAALAFF